ncbi:hypothetical protein JCM10449v2_007201 [Rhodotorula kratochvilovae]
MRLLATLAALAGFASLSAAIAIGPQCPPGAYFDSYTCARCPVNVETCQSATVATVCVPDYYLTADKQCVAEDDCPINTYADAASQSCRKCYVHDAATCRDSGPYSTTSCTTGCLRGNLCYPRNRVAGGFYCPDHVWTPCPGTLNQGGAKTCDDEGNTLTCRPGRVVVVRNGIIDCQSK